MTTSPQQPRPDQPEPREQATEQTAEQAAEQREHGHRLAVIALCGAVIAALASGVAVLIAVLGNGDQQAPADGSNHAPAAHAPSKSGSGSPAGSKPSGSQPPTSAAQKVIKLADHPLLGKSDLGLPNLVCSLPDWNGTEDGAKGFFRAATRCLDRAWEPLLREHDLPFTPPRLYFPTGPRFGSDCGNIKVGIDTAAYYCEGELFLPFGGLQLEQYQDNPGVYLALIAHEYGHHVQELSGIMDAVWRKIYQAGETSDRVHELSRRKELQAQCFSGMFLGAHVDRGGSVTREMYDKAWHDQETRGDDTSGGHDHGSNANYAQWWRIGALDNRVSDCNTFAAGDRSVR